MDTLNKGDIVRLKSDIHNPLRLTIETVSDSQIICVYRSDNDIKKIELSKDVVCKADRLSNQAHIDSVYEKLKS